jgi:tetratricopeptide (TPR) repeat protein
MAANKALQYDPKNAEAFVALARGDIQDDLKTISELYEKAYALAPKNADVVNLYADFMMIVGDFTASERLEQEAIALDPLAAVHHSDIAGVLYSVGRYEEGLEYGRTSVSLEPDSDVRADPLIVGLIFNGQYDEAIETIKHFEQLPGSDTNLISWWWCLLYYQQGDEQKLREKVAERMQYLESDPDKFDTIMTALFITWLDGTDAALPILKVAYAINEYNLMWPEFFYLPEDISDDPDWLAFWQQPRLAELIEIRRSNKTLEHIGLWKARLEP